MKSGRDRPYAGAFLAAVLIAPILSMSVALLAAMAWSAPDIVGAVSAASVLPSILRAFVGVFVLGAIVTLWGVAPSAVFGLAGAAASERWLRTDLWWVWGLTGLATSAAYIAASLIGDRFSPSLSFFMAPWIYLSRYGGAGVAGDPALPLSGEGLMVFAPCILIAGFGAGSTYFRISRRGWKPKGADKRT